VSVDSSAMAISWAHQIQGILADRLGILTDVFQAFLIAFRRKKLLQLLSLNFPICNS